MALIDLATINFAGRGNGGSSPGTRNPDFDLDYNQDFRAALPETDESE